MSNENDKVGKPASRPFDDDKFYRFSDLQKLGLCRSWPSVRLWQQNAGFPAGHLIGRTRCWTGLELNDYYETRPTGPSAPRSPGRPRKQPEQQTAA
jgi:hypothetical protein